VLLVNSTEQLSICNEIHRLQLSSDSLIRDHHTRAAVSASTTAAKLDAQNASSQKILSMLTGEDDCSTRGEIGDARHDLDENVTTVTSFPEKQTRIHLEHLGRIATRGFLEARNIADAQAELLNEIKGMLQQMSTPGNNREQDGYLRTISRELMNRASLLGQQLLNR